MTHLPFNKNTKTVFSPSGIAIRILLALVCLMLWLACAGAANAYIIINAPMTDTNAAGWVLGGNPASAALTGNGAIDPVGSGWLRLTNSSGNQTGFAYNNTTFDLSSGALIQFDDASWGGSGADGFSVFLFDANVSPFNIGAFGGSLGYAQKLPPAVNPAVPGVSGGYVGIGIDEYGNFSNPTEGRYLGPGARPNTVTIRGSVVGFGGGAIGSTSDATSYPWIATSGNNGSLWINSGTRPGQTSANYRKVIVQISPAPNPVANVWVQFGYNTSPVQMISNQALPSISSSQQLMVGFGGSTGGSTNYHELRNLLITTLGESTSIDLGITKTPVATGTATPAIMSATVGTPFQYLITARNYGPNNITATGVGITDTFPAPITPGTWTCVATGGATCGTASGSGSLNTTANIPRYGAVTYTVNATLNAMPAGNLLSNTAALTIPGAVTDYNSGNNSATSTINAYGLPTVTKSFSPAAVPLSTNSALTITLTNPNNVAVTGVAFTDTFPANLVNETTTATTVCGGTLTPTNGAPAKLAFAGGTIPANGSCTITTNVQSATAATYTNTLASGAVTTTNIGSNAVAATSTLTVLSPPTVTKSFAVGSMASGDTTNLTVSIGNTNSSAIALTSALTDTFPANMTIATDGNTGTCTGITATAGDNKFTMASGTSIPTGGCTVIVNVTSSATSGISTNTIAAGALKTTAGNNAAAASDSLTMHNAATLTKAYSATTIAAGDTSTLTFTITNGGGRPAQSGLAFTDTFPAGLTVTAAGAVTGNGCSGTPAFTPSTVTLANGAITGGSNGTNGPCTFTATVRGDTGGTYVNNSGQFSGVGGGLRTSATTATLNVYEPATITKSFAPDSIAAGGTSVMTLILASPATNPGNLTTVRVDDTFPAGMTLKNNTFTFTPAACGTVTKISGGASAAGDNNVRFTDTTQSSGASCQVQLNVTVSSANIFTNTTNAPTATGPVALTGTAATALLSSTQAPTVTKAFAVGTIASGGNTNLTVSLSNTNAGAISLTSDFTDTFPAGMTIGTAGNTGTCTGVTATAGASGFTMANGTSIPVGGCTVIVNVTSATAGAAVNTIAANALQTSAGNNTAAATATLNVYAPPTVTKTFVPTSISYGGSTVLTLTLGNPSANVAAITTAQVDDTFPGGLTLQNTTFTFTPAACGTVTRTTGAASAAGDNNVRFIAATTASGAICKVAVNIASSAAASITNTTNAPIAAGPVSLTGTAANATLTVAPIAPTVTKAFDVGSIASGGSTNLTVTIGNTNAGAITLISAFTDTFPTGMTIDTAGNTGTCSGVTATAGDNKFTMTSGASIPAGGCTIIVNVKSSTAGAAMNTIAAGTLQTVAGSNVAATSATLNVYAPPTLAKTFGAPSIGAGGSTTLTLTLGNPSANVAAITTVDADDTFPAGLTLQNTTFSFTPAACGTVTNTSGAASAAGDANIRFIAASIASGATCQVVVNVTSSTAGSITNTTNAPTASGPVSLTGAAASAPLTVTLLPAPSVVKTFSPTQIVKNGTSLLTVTLTNQSGIDITGVAFSDTLPTSPGQMTTMSVLTNSCSGTGTIGSGNKSFTLTGGTIPANGSCYLSVSVTAATLGTYNNTTSTVTSTNASTAAAASASLTVALLAPPNVAKSFASNQIGVSGTSVMTITLTNPNVSDITGAALTDTYPNGLSNTGALNATTTCTGGTATAANGAGNGSLTLSGATIPASSSCKVTVSVTSAVAGAYVNSTGPVTTTNANSGSSASATLNVLQAPTATKAFAPAEILPNGSSVLTVTLSNPNSIAIAGAAFTDIYPNGLFNTGALNAATTCTSGTATASNGAGNGSLTLAGATIPGNGSCTVTVTVTSAANGTYNNSFGTITTTNAGTGTGASGTLTVAQPTVQVAKTSNNGTGSFAFVGTNGVAANFNIATATAGTPVSGSVYTVTSTAANVTLTETPPAGWPANPVSASCTDSNGTISSNGAGTFGTLVNNVLTILPANLKAGAQIVCSFVNTATATITVNKVLSPASDTGTFNLLVGVTTVASAIGNGGTGNTTVPANAVVTVSETGAGGTLLTNYATSYSCTGGTNGVGTSVSVTPTPGQNITCTFTNNRLATVTVVKQSNGGTASFSYTGGTNGLPASLTLDTSTANPQSSAVYTVTANGTDTAITETVPAGWTLNAAATSCTDGATAFGTLAGSTLTIPTANVAAGKNIICTFTNDKHATITVKKQSNGGTGSFSFAGTNGVAASFTLDTSIVNPQTSAVYTVAALNTDTTITETVPAGWTLSSASCTDGTTTFGTLAGGTLTIPALDITAGKNIVCTFTNSSAPPTVRIAKTANGTGSFGFTHTNLSNASDSITVTTPTGTPSTVASSSTSTVTAIANPVTIQESTVPIGWPVNPVSASCVDANSGVTGNSGSFGSLSANTLTIPASYLRSGAQILCTFTNTAPGTGLVLVKAVDKATAYPGDVLTYTITYSNSGLASLTNIDITDNVPAYTYNPVASCVNPLPNFITGCTVVTTSSSVSWLLSGSLSPSASGQVKLSVTIQQ